MGEPQAQYPSIQLGTDVASPIAPGQLPGQFPGQPPGQILGDFYIQHHHYLVVCPENQFQPFIDQTLDHSYKRLITSLAGHMSVNQQYCAIVEVELETEIEPTAKENKSDITSVLTARELQIVHLVAQGHPNKQVAHQLHISEWTVSTHLRRIFAKLGVDSRAAMVYRCSSRLNALN